MEVRVEALEVPDLSGVPHARGLHHLAARAPRGLAAVRGPLVTVQLEQA